MKIIEVIADSSHYDTILGIAEQHAVEEVWFTSHIEGVNEETGERADRIVVRLLVDSDRRQRVLDALQTVLSSSSNFRVLMIPLDTALPKPVAPPPEQLSEEEIEQRKIEDKERKRAALMSTREEILTEVEKGAQLDNNFVLLVVLSAIVAAIGLLENNLAVIVGAMVIAPLLGPNIAFSLGTSLGEKQLVVESLKTLAVGVGLAITVSIALGLIWPGPFNSYELMMRTDATYSGTAIALASGAAASLSLISGLSSVLVGVMVAVALMPPAVTIGLMLSIGENHHAFGALLLLAVNIVCINLSAKLVFLFRGIRPRTWLEAHKASQSRLLYISIWVTLLSLLIIIMYLKHNNWEAPIDLTSLSWPPAVVI